MGQIQIQLSSGVEAGSILHGFGEPEGKLLDGQPIGEIEDPDDRAEAVDEILSEYDLGIDWESKYPDWGIVPISRHSLVLFDTVPGGAGGALNGLAFGRRGTFRRVVTR